MFVSAGSPVIAFVAAFRGALLGDAALLALVTGVFGQLSESARTPYPYLVLGRRSHDPNGGAFQTPGGRVTLQLDGWSDAKGPYEMQAICSRVLALMERRRPFLVPGFEALEGSLTCEMEEIFDEPDTDKPDARLYHGVQRWSVEVHGL